MALVRVLIVDDEPLGRERIRALLSENDAVEVVGECQNGKEAVDTIKSTAIDLVFLDVQMPEMNGFEVIDAVGTGTMPHVIFVTAYDQHALDAFEVHALDYLLKPFEIDRFNEALQHALNQINQEQQLSQEQQVQHLLSQLHQPKKWLERIVIKTRSHLYFISCKDIDWIEAAGNYVTIHSAGKQHFLRQTLTSLSAQLQPDQFIRIHRSTIVNIDRIQSMYPMASGEYEVLLDNGKKLTLSRSYRQSLDQFIP